MNGELTGDEYFPHDTYHTQWFIFWVIVVISAILLWLNFFRPAPITEPPRAAISSGYDWFFVLHMPEIPKDPVKAAALEKTFGAWLEALAKEDYQPMLLSDIERRWTHDSRLPSRAVVLVFDPGYFHTYEALAPTLVQYRFPALWVNDRTSILRGDRHFVHRHQAAWMVKSGYWDLGYSGDGFWREEADSKKMLINNSLSATWADGTGRRALNWGTDLPRLNRLDVNPKWTPEELIARLEMELPLQGTVRLSAKHIEHHLWGVVMPTARQNSRFSFQAPLASTSSNLYWFGTRGASDVQLDVNIPSFFGEVSLWLRSDHKEGQGVGVGFTRGHLYVDQKIDNLRKRLAYIRWSPPSGAIKGRITVVGSELQLTMEGAEPLHVSLSPETRTSQGIVRLEVFDRIRGAARADFIDLVLTALSKPPH